MSSFLLTANILRGSDQVLVLQFQNRGNLTFYRAWHDKTSSNISKAHTVYFSFRYPMTVEDQTSQNHSPKTSNFLKDRITSFSIPN